MRSGFHHSAFDFLRMRFLSPRQSLLPVDFCPVIVRIKFSGSAHQTRLNSSLFPDSMKETAAKRRDKAGGRDRDSKSDKSKEPKEAKDAAPEQQDVEMPEEDAANTAKQPKELDSLTLEGKAG